MPHTNKKKKEIIPPSEIEGFSWGGNTVEWEEQAEKFMQALQNQIDNQESEEEIQKKIEYAKHNYQ